MLPFCSATTSCSSHSQISLHGGLRSFSLYRKTFEVRCILEHGVVLGFPNGIHSQGVSFKSNSMGAMFKPHAVQARALKFIEISSVSNGEEEAVDFTGRLNENSDIVPNPANPQTIAIMDVDNLPNPVDPQTITITDAIPEDTRSISDSLNMNANSLSSLKTNAVDIFGGIKESIIAALNKGENAVENSLDTINSSIASALKDANATVDNAVSKVLSSVNQTGKLAGDRLTGLSSDSKEATNRVGLIAVDVLRRSIVAVEDSLTKGATFVVYGYGSVKELLPQEIKNVVDISEEKVINVSRPVGTAFLQVYTALEGLERSLGLDPSDPIIPFVLFLGTSATLWGSYWVLTYGGYAGDLSPKLTLTLLSGKESAVLIDVRPEDFREKDGVPDLRRAARSRYANITLPEVDGSVRKLIKSGNEFDDTLIAIVIRNLKAVNDRSKVIVMDVDGSRSKGIARSLRKLGVKRPYVVQGGFRSWVKEGLRVKELKPETTLTILNEEAEAILEEVNPTPLKVLGYGVGVVAAAYSLLEWEKTLQLIGVVGLGLTIYRRIASYEDSEDFKQDVSLLLVPVKMGGQAISWAAGKLEKNGNGLPTSPSSTDIQSRVLQAAAKHESQPSDSEENLGMPPESMDAGPSEA